MRHLAAGEHLEQRALLAISAYGAGAGGAITSGWVTLVADSGDDVYVQQIAPASSGQTVYTPSLLYADNSSFLGAKEIGDINSFNDLIITSGITVSGTKTNTVITSDAYPFVAAGSNRTEFYLNAYDVEQYWKPISGIISNGVGGRWTFDKPQYSRVFTITPEVAVGPVPLSMLIRSNESIGQDDGSDVLEVNWDSSLVGAGGLSAASPPVIERFDASLDSSANYPVALANIPATSGQTVAFTLPRPASLAEGSPYTLIRGAVKGKLNIPLLNASVEFTTDSADSSSLVFLDRGSYSSQFSFNVNTLGTPGDLIEPIDTSSSVTGRLVVSPTGEPQVVFSFVRTWYGLLDGGVGPATITADYAVSGISISDNSTAVSDCIFVAGQDISRRLFIDMAQAGSTVMVNSPVVVSSDSPADHCVEIRASNVFLNAPVSSGTSFIAGPSLSGSKCEQLFFNATISAQTFDLRVADDPNTGSITRSTIFFSPSGSLGGGGGAIAATLFAQVTGGDVFIEGTIAAANQSWLMQSPQAASVDAVPDRPYIISTTAAVSGAATGLIRGRSVAITLGNDLPSLYDLTEIGGSTALSVVTLQTDIDSLRITAADRKGNLLATAFPYDVQIKEGYQGGDGSITIDAVSSSSRTLEFIAKNNITFKAALSSAADVLVSSEAGQIKLEAPLSTAFGTIELSANSLTIGNSVRVLDATPDEFDNDIILTARSGDMLLNGPIAAINGIRLNQNGAGNVIRGPSRLIADRLEIQAQGSADLVTSVREVSGSVGGGIAISEADSLVITDLSAGDKKVSVTVGGEDYYLSNSDGTPDITGGRLAALRANLSDVNELVVSAPLGSIDVFVNSTKDIVLGNLTTIQDKTAASMTAAGSVRILTSAAGITAYDAPVAGASARQVSAASTGDLPGVFDPRQPGVYSATLSGSGSLNALSAAIDGVSDLRVGELVLLKDQTAGRQNGIYRIISVGSSAPGGKWVLARASDFDASTEVKLNTWIRPVRGATQAQQLFSVTSFGEADDETASYSTPRRVSAVTNVGPAYAVRAISSAALAATYTIEDDAALGKIRTLTAGKEGAIPTFDGVKVVAGDTVLVRQGHLKDGAVNTESVGVYVVVVAGDETTPWKLQAVDEFEIGRVVANEGSLRASRTGQAFDVAYDYLNNATMHIDAVGSLDVPQQIGSGDINDAVQFVVTTNLGTNNSVGSLGKMLTIVQANAVEVDDPENEGATIPQRQSLAFASNLGGTIQLTQALPTIRRQLVIDAAAARVAVPGTRTGVVVDGSRIVTRSDFTAVGATGTVNGLEFVGAGASGSVLNGLVFGGFSKGAAVVANGAADLLISNLRLGENAAGVKLGNKQGIIVRNGAGGYTTILNNVIRSSSGAAIQVAGDNAANAVRIVGNTIGSAAAENGTGIDLGTGNNLVGTAPVDVTLKRLSVSKVRTSSTQFQLPAGFQQLSLLRIGLGVVSSRITAPEGSPVATILSISAPDAVTKVVTVEIDGTIEGTGAAMVVDIGVFVQPEEDDPSRIKLPGCVNIEDVFLGQVISGTNVAAGTTIVAIEGTAGSYTLTLSKPFPRNEPQAIVFVAGGRNQLLFNNYGIVQRAGTSRIYNTTVGSSVFDGIKIDGGTATIGLGAGKNPGADGRSPSKDRDVASSNVIYGSGLAGVRVAPTLTSDKIDIQGNYLGVTASGAASANKSGNIVGPASVVSRLKIGAVTTASADGRALTITLAGHGLADGAFVWLKIGANAVGNSYRVTRLTANTFRADVAGVTTVVTKPVVGNTVKVAFYGSKTAANELAGTGSIDFEGNQHGIAVALPSVGASTSTGTGSGTGTSTGGVTTGRPVVRPVSRPAGR
jgi:hypothetical protein